MALDTNNQNLDGKVALITGASGGIGSATARRFAALGATLMLTDIDEDALKKLADELRQEGASVALRTCDVSKEKDVKQLVSQTIDKFGRIDILFNNAGIEGPRNPVTEYDTDDFDKVIDINLKGVFFGMKYVIERMLENDEGGAIVNTASIAGRKGFEGLTPYVASKHAVIGMTKTAALEFAEKKIRVNAICPGVIQTPMVERDSGGDLDAYKEMEPVGRLGQPEEVADLVAFLCSDRSRFITGTAVHIDGGILAG